MSEYDPFVRGPFPVGVRSAEWVDEGRAGRRLPVEIYYPASAEARGRDLDPASQDRFQLPGSMGGDAPKRQKAVRDAGAASGDFPLVLFSHGYSGDRRETSFLCTHLVSHGYRVVSADHIGSTFSCIRAEMEDEAFDRRAGLKRRANDRLGDVPFLISRACVEFGQDFQAVGVMGVSMGGWTSLVAPSVDARVKAIAPLCPAGGTGPLASGGGHLGDYLRWDWRQPAATFLMVGDRDTWLPLYGTLEVLADCPTPNKKVAILRRADHQHFVDDMEVCHGWLASFTSELAEKDTSPNAPPWGAMAKFVAPFSELMPEAEAMSILNGLVTQHMDAHIKAVPSALEADLQKLKQELAARDLHAFLVAL